MSAMIVKFQIKLFFIKLQLYDIKIWRVISIKLYFVMKNKEIQE